MKIDLKIVSEYDALFGGAHERRHTGNAFMSLVNHHFKDSLIFAIIENVNLNNTSLYGLGDMLFFTHKEFRDENQRIKDGYKAAIKKVQGNFENSVSEYADWYDIDSVMILVETGSTQFFDPEKSAWRSNIIANKEEKGEKDKYGFLDFSHPEKTFHDFVKEYYSYYIKVLNADLEFENFPYYAVIGRPIANRGSKKTIKLGNIYLHFATHDLKDEDFYKRFLNDFMLVWMREEGGVVLQQIADRTRESTQKAFSKNYKTYLPAIWAKKDDKKFSRGEIDKIDNLFGNSGQILNEFFETIFIKETDKYGPELAKHEKIILDELIPALLKAKEWLKKGEQAQPAEPIIKKIKKNVEHKAFDGFDEKELKRFVHLLNLRHVFNLCFCCFNFNIHETHCIFLNGSIENKCIDDPSYVNKLTGYFSKLFIYCPIDPPKNIISLDQQDVYQSVSLKENEFLKFCSQKIDQLIAPEARAAFNEAAVSEFKVTGTGEKNKTDAVSFSAVYDFKKNWCDENKTISLLLKNEVGDDLIAPILDCGAGLGDIAYCAFPEKEAVLIDVNKMEDAPLSTSHTHITTSIFDYYPEKKIHTMLLSHTLQFIDADIDKLNQHIQRIDPQHIVIVANRNNDMMGEILAWTKKQHPNSNPEEILPGFPQGYALKKKIEFQANIECNTFEQLTRQISYLMMIDPKDSKDALEGYLQSKLKRPGFNFNQVIEVYQKA